MDDAGIKPSSQPLIHLLSYVDIHIYKHPYTYKYLTQKQVMKKSIMQRVSATLQGNKTNQDTSIIYQHE